MYAAATTYDLKPGKRDKSIAIAKTPVWEEILSGMRKVRGFKSLHSMVESNSDKALVIVMYETEADLIAGGESPHAKEAWMKIADFVDMESLVRTVYEVVAEG